MPNGSWFVAVAIRGLTTFLGVYLHKQQAQIKIQKETTSRHLASVHQHHKGGDYNLDNLDNFATVAVDFAYVTDRQRSRCSHGFRKASSVTLQT